MFLIVTLSLLNLKVHLLPLKAQKQASPFTSPDVVDVTELVIIVVDSVRMAGHRLEAGPQIAANCLELPSPTEKDFQRLAFLQG